MQITAKMTEPCLKITSPYTNSVQLYIDLQADTIRKPYKNSLSGKFNLQFHDNVQCTLYSVHMHLVKICLHNTIYYMYSCPKNNQNLLSFFNIFFRIFHLVFYNTISLYKLSCKTKQPQANRHKNQVCNGWSSCNGICLVSACQIYSYTSICQTFCIPFGIN